MSTGIARALGKLDKEWSVPSLWALSNRLLRGRRMTFCCKSDLRYHRPWQIAPLDDTHPRIVVRKPRQVGFTEVMLTKAIHLATLCRTSSIYTMPKWGKAEEMARLRIRPLGIPNSEDRFLGRVRERFFDWRSLMHKRFTPLHGGESVFIITGSWSEDLGESTAADAVYLDEYDRMKPGVISAFDMSLSASHFGYLRIFSTPTFPNVGVDGVYQQSDKKRYFYKCSKCNHWQYMTVANVMQAKGSDSLIQRLESHDPTARVPDGTFRVVCTKCHCDISRVVEDAEWVEEVTSGSEMSGYALTQADAPWLTGDVIYRRLRDLRPGLGPWMNYVWGLPYLGDMGSIVEGWLYSLVDAEFPKVVDGLYLKAAYPNALVSIGIDWGKSNWYLVKAHIRDKPVPYILEVGSFMDTDDPQDTVDCMVAICRRWKADIVVADWGYGQDRNPKMHMALRPTFWACLYPSSPKSEFGSTGKPVYGPNPSPSGVCPVLKVGRASSLKGRIIAIRKEGVAIAPMAEELLDLFDMHCRNVTITQETMASGEVVEVAVTTGADHLLHCENYSDIGIQKLLHDRVHMAVVDAPDSIPADDDMVANSGMPTGGNLLDMYDLLGY